MESNNQAKSQTWPRKVWTTVKPWLAALVVLIILKSTGLLAGITDYARMALLSAGASDFRESPPGKSTPFNYAFTLKTLEGDNVNFADFKGKVIFLNLWATWCGPCRAEMPAIQSLYSKISDDRIQFIMLSIDKDGLREKVKQYVDDKQFTFPVYMPSGALTSQLNVPSIPTTFVIDKEGNIVEKKVGTTNFDTPKFKNYLEDLAKR
jgi:thiol-disulfide isomerase/thioredoxin